MNKKHGQTDGPFVNDNNVALRPGQVSTVIMYLAKEWSLSVPEVENIIMTNFRRLMSLDKNS